MTAVEFVLPDPNGHDPDSGDPFWLTPVEDFDDTETITATPAGIEIDGEVHAAVDTYEQVALAMLAAIAAHRTMHAGDTPAAHLDAELTDPQFVEALRLCRLANDAAEDGQTPAGHYLGKLRDLLALTASKGTPPWLT